MPVGVAFVSARRLGMLQNSISAIEAQNTNGY